MPADHSEKGLEHAIENHMLNRRYRKSDPAYFHASFGLGAQALVGFLKSSRPDGWAHNDSLQPRPLLDLGRLLHLVTLLRFADLIRKFLNRP
jgi:hypothetical protein